MYIISQCKGTEAWAGNGFATLGQGVRNGHSKQSRLECGEKSVPISGKNIPEKTTVCADTLRGNRAWHRAGPVWLEHYE